MPVPLIGYAVLTGLDETDNMKICIFLFDDDGPALFLYADNIHGVAAYMRRKCRDWNLYENWPGRRGNEHPSYHSRNQVRLELESYHHLIIR